MKIFLSTILTVSLIASGCQSSTQTGNNNGANSANTAAKPVALKVNDVVKAFQTARMPLNQLDFYNAATDPDKMLGKPNQYTEKVVWQTKETMKHAVETFANDADVQARKKVLEADKKFSGDFIYTHKNVLLRINKEMVPETAAKFEQILKAM